MADVEICFSDRLVGQFHRLDQLLDIYERLQVATVDTWQMDLLTFAESATYFSIILAKQKVEGAPAKPQPSPGSGSHISEEEVELAIGMVYLAPPSQFEDPLHLNEVNIGIILDAKYQGLGYARRATAHVLEVAFEEEKVHRVQAIIPDYVSNERSRRLFTGMRFTHEGVRRHAYWSPLTNEYKNVTYLGMLDIDWISRGSRIPPAPSSAWDELFARHQREREELLNWEMGLPPRRRTLSTTTIRGMTTKPSDAMSDAGSATADEAMSPFGDAFGDEYRVLSDFGSRSPSISSSRPSSPSETHSDIDADGAWDVIPETPSGWSSSVSSSAHDDFSDIADLADFDDAEEMRT